VKFVAALLMIAALSLAPGDLKLEVAGDGAEGVTVRAFGADGRPAEGDIRLVLTASAEGGRTVGPLQLNPAAEGRGFYTSGPVLSPGTWTVVVTGPGADPVKATSVVQSRRAQSPPPAAAAKPAPAAPPSSSHLWWWGLAAAVAAAAVAVTAVVRLRRTT
jgi:hypothetical protein